MDYKVGDRVRCIEPYDRANIVGMVGTVVKIYREAHGKYCQDLAIEFDEHMGGHSCSMADVKDGHGWNIPADRLEPAEPFYGPPCPEAIVQERKVREKARTLWNKSKFVVKHPHLAY